MFAKMHRRSEWLNGREVLSWLAFVSSGDGIGAGEAIFPLYTPGRGKQQLVDIRGRSTGGSARHPFRILRRIADGQGKSNRAVVER
jgi:hypothetical protein